MAEGRHQKYTFLFARVPTSKLLGKAKPERAMLFFGGANGSVKRENLTKGCFLVRANPRFHPVSLTLLELKPSSWAPRGLGPAGCPAARLKLRAAITLGHQIAQAMSDLFQKFL